MHLDGAVYTDFSILLESSTDESCGVHAAESDAKLDDLNE